MLLINFFQEIEYVDGDHLQLSDADIEEMYSDDLSDEDTGGKLPTKCKSDLGQCTPQ